MPLNGENAALALVVDGSRRNPQVKRRLPDIEQAPPRPPDLGPEIVDLDNQPIY